MEIFKKHSALISTTNKSLTLNQKKSLNAFYKNAQIALEKGQKYGDWYKMDLEIVKDIIGAKTVNSKRLKDELWKLTKIDVEYNIFKKDKVVGWRKFGLLTNDLKIDYDEDGKAFFKYKLSETVEENLVKPNIFAKIDLAMIKGLSSKYAVILYELLEDYKKVNVPYMTIEEFREFMGVEEDKYKMVADLKKRVIEVIKDEINEKTKFTVSYEFKKKMRKIIGIQWTIIDVDDSKQDKALERLEFIKKVRNTYKEGDIIIKAENTVNHVNLVMGKNGLLNRLKPGTNKSQTYKKAKADELWTWLFENSETMEKPPRTLF